MKYEVVKQGLDLLFCLIDISAKTPVLGVFSYGDKKGNFEDRKGNFTDKYFTK